jgi:twitching motility protein PilJ
MQRIKSKKESSKKQRVSASLAQTSTSSPKRAANWLDNLRVQSKLSLIVAALGLGIVVSAISVFLGFNNLKNQLSNLSEITLPSIDQLNQANTAFADTQRSLLTLRDGIIAANESARNSYIEQINANDLVIRSAIKQYQDVWQISKRPSLIARVGDDTVEAEQSALEALATDYDDASVDIKSFLDTVKKGRPVTQLATASTSGVSQARASLQTLLGTANEVAGIATEESQATYQRTLIQIALSLIVSVILGLILAFLISRSITSRLSKLETQAQSLREGNLEAVADLPGRDEISIVSRALGTSVTQLREFIGRQEDERQRGLALQQNVSEFLDVAMNIAGGDLTQRGKVSEDALGNVVDAINLMTDEIGYLLKDVQRAAVQVGSSATSMTKTSSGIVSNAQTQSNTAETTNTQVLEVTNAIRGLANRAGETALVAQQTLLASQSGQAAVSATQTELGNIRDQVRSLTTGMNTLALRSSEISEIVRTISRISSQTNLLALGASLEAAGAGEAGLRFAAVADSVRKLADDSARSAQAVANIVKAVQSDIQNMVERVQGSAGQVEQGYNVAAQAGEQLTQIARLATQSATEASSISSEAQNHAASVEKVRIAVSSISSSAMQTQNASLEGQNTAETLRALAEQLNKSLSRFQLPA